MSISHPNATKEVLDYIDSMPDFSKSICKKLRSIILKTDKNIVEDWKWGPNYSFNGMLCGFGAFKTSCEIYFLQWLRDEGFQKLIQSLCR